MEGSPPKKPRLFFWLGILTVLAVLPLTILVTTQFRQDVRQRAATPNLTAILKLSSPATTYAKDEEFEVEILLDTGGQSVGGGQVRVSYDPAKIGVQTITPGKEIPQTPPMLPNVLRKEFKENEKVIHLDQGVALENPQPYLSNPNSPGIYGRLKFKALAEGSTTLSFLLTHTPPHSSEATGDTDILVLQDSTVYDTLKETHPLTLTISGPASSPLTCTVLPDFLTLRPNQTQALTVLAAGGLAPYAYAWSASGGTLSPNSGDDTTWTAPASAGTYTLTSRVTDHSSPPQEKSCQAEATVTTGPLVTLKIVFKLAEVAQPKRNLPVAVSLKNKKQTIHLIAPPKNADYEITMNFPSSLAGQDELGLKPEGYLKQTKAVTLTAGQTVTADFSSATFIAGDLDGDNQLTPADLTQKMLPKFSELNTLSFTVNAENQIMDFNQDGVINVLDVSIILKNF